MSWLIVGLGNPGSAYAATRHNIGYLVADQVANIVGGRFKRHRPTRSLVVEGRFAGSPVVLGRSREFMNESGAAVAAQLRYFKIPADRLIVIHDELDIGPEQLRVKFGGGDNGHNGLKSIRAAIGTGEFYRVRAGIGRPAGNEPVHKFVLQTYAAAERHNVDELIDRSVEAIASLIERGLAATQSEFNS